MAEYNSYYLSLKKRLNILKLTSQANTGLTEEQKDARLTSIDSLLKMLDERYSEGLYLENIEDALLVLEGE